MAVQNYKSLFHFEFLKLSEEEQSLLGLLGMWFELIFHQSVLLILNVCQDIYVHAYIRTFFFFFCFSTNFLH